MRPQTLLMFPFCQLEIFGHDTLYQPFQALYADTLERQRCGLQFVTELDPHWAMIFPRAAAITLERTIIPLDVLFIDANGVIDSMICNAQPLSETPIRSRVPALAAIELAGGRCARSEIRPGDLARWTLPNEGTS